MKMEKSQQTYNLNKDIIVCPLKKNKIKWITNKDLWYST